MDVALLQQLAVSFGLGVLLGLERERTESSVAGIRTLPIVSLFGTACAVISRNAGGWVIAAGLLSLAAVLVVANFAKIKRGDIEPGMTTEVAVLALYGIGVLAVVANIGVAMVMGGAVALLLHCKKPMHRFALAVGPRDMRAIMQFVLLTLIVLPLLPDRGYGPFGVLNPFGIWLMVVLIVGISLAGYVVYKLLGTRAGTLVGGLLGGLISSTATTVSFARRSVAHAGIISLSALVILIASCTSLVRVLVEISIVAPGKLATMAPPLAVMLGACLAITVALFFRSWREQTEMPKLENPAEFKAAFIFGGLYAIILLAVAAAENTFGAAGVYVVGAISGLTDMDAITLSSAQLAASGHVDVGTAWRVILVAAMANFIFKFGIIATLGSRALVRRIGLAFGCTIASGIAILWLWPR
ncbi:MAG TPA: MgtC/SapB family protein [Chthoniobacterales bacterium]